MMVAKKKLENLHSKHGWNYDKVNRIINEINDILVKEKITFVEQLVVFNWFDAQLVYNMGKHGAKDFLEESFPKQPVTKPVNSGIA